MINNNKNHHNNHRDLYHLNNINQNKLNFNNNLHYNKEYTSNYNSNCNYNIINTKLFYLVWKNIYLKKIIFHHLKYFKLFSQNRIFKNVQQLLSYHHYEYLSTITFQLNDRKVKSIDLADLPSNIDFIKFNMKFFNSLPPVIYNLPLWLVGISVTYSKYSDIVIFLKLPYLKILYLTCVDCHTEIEEYGDLYNCAQLEEFAITQYKHLIKNGTLPKMIKKLFISSSFNKDLIIERNALPSTLINFSVNRLFDNCIYFYFDQLPSGLKTFKSRSEIFNYEDQSKFFTNYPPSLTSLELFCKRNFKLPENLKHLKIFIEKEVVDIPFPNSIVDLEITYSDSIKQNPYSNLYFNNLPKLNMKSLVTDTRTLIDLNGYNILNYGLETLKFIQNDKIYDIKDSLGFDKEIELHHLPGTLQVLDFGKIGSFNNGGKPFKQFIFPSSLTYLRTGNAFNQAIDVNVLPKNLKVLCLGKNYIHSIEPQIFPSSLKVLKLKNEHYYRLFTPPPDNPNLIVMANCYKFYTQNYINKPELLKSVKISKRESEPLENYKLINKPNIEYLHYSSLISNLTTIDTKSLPKENNIKILRFDNFFCRTISLDDFPNLETIIIDGISCCPELITSQYIDEDDGKTIHNNLYKLKSIYILYQNVRFINFLNPVFYNFIKYMKPRSYLVDENNNF